MQIYQFPRHHHQNMWDNSSSNLLFPLFQSPCVNLHIEKKFSKRTDTTNQNSYDQLDFKTSIGGIKSDVLKIRHTVTRMTIWINSQRKKNKKERKKETPLRRNVNTIPSTHVAFATTSNQITSCLNQNPKMYTKLRLTESFFTSINPSNSSYQKHEKLENFRLLGIGGNWQLKKYMNIVMKRTLEGKK